jgi:hypothetical protein
MQEQKNNNQIVNTTTPLNMENSKLLVDFFDLLLQWNIEDERKQKEEDKKIQTTI